MRTEQEIRDMINKTIKATSKFDTARGRASARQTVYSIETALSWVLEDETTSPKTERLEEMIIDLAAFANPKK